MITKIKPTISKQANIMMMAYVKSLDFSEYEYDNGDIVFKSFPENEEFYLEAEFDEHFLLTKLSDYYDNENEDIREWFDLIGFSYTSPYIASKFQKGFYSFDEQIFFSTTPTKEGFEVEVLNKDLMAKFIDYMDNRHVWTTYNAQGNPVQHSHNPKMEAIINLGFWIDKIEGNRIHASTEHHIEMWRTDMPRIETIFAKENRSIAMFKL